jgi:tRNA-Thr(GGU) m(6)t(6)A37 methyltransferase TsaA
MSISYEPIGHVRTEAERVPRHWSVSDETGELVLDPQYEQGLVNIRPGEKIVVLFHFHKSGNFGQAQLTQTPPHRSGPRGVFSICSPIRPNPIGMSVLEVLAVEANVVLVKGVDMLDGTPILDIKPLVGSVNDCPSRS